MVLARFELFLPVIIITFVNGVWKCNHGEDTTQPPIIKLTFDTMLHSLKMRCHSRTNNEYKKIIYNPKDEVVEVNEKITKSVAVTDPARYIYERDGLRELLKYYHANTNDIYLEPKQDTEEETITINPKQTILVMEKVQDCFYDINIVEGNATHHGTHDQYIVLRIYHGNSIVYFSK